MSGQKPVGERARNHSGPDTIEEQKTTMALIQFTRNHRDHFTDKGFQFNFSATATVTASRPSLFPPPSAWRRACCAPPAAYSAAFSAPLAPTATKSSSPSKDRRMTRLFAKPSKRRRLISANVRNAPIGFARRPAGTPSARSATPALRISRPRSPRHKCKRPSIK